MDLEHTCTYQRVHSLRFAATLQALARYATRLPIWPWVVLLKRLKLGRPHQRLETHATVASSDPDAGFEISYVVERMTVRLYNGHETYYCSFYLRVRQTATGRAWFKQCCVTSCGHMMGEHDTMNEDLIREHFDLDAFSIRRLQQWIPPG